MRFVLAAAGAAAPTLVLASVASAHAIMSPPVAKSKLLQQFTLSVPTEEEGATTTEIRLTVPDGFAIDSFEPSPGWKRTEAATGSGEATPPAETERPSGSTAEPGTSTTPAVEPPA